MLGILLALGASQLQVGLCNKYIGQAGRAIGVLYLFFETSIKTDPNWPFMMPKSHRHLKRLQ
jgi:hypothetical protein